MSNKADKTIVIGPGGLMNVVVNNASTDKEAVEITKAKLRDELFLELEYCMPGPDSKLREHTVKCNTVVHPDLTAAFKMLVVHLAIICEIHKPEDHIDEVLTYWHQDLDPLTVTGFSIGGTDENEGVTIIGRKMLKTGKVLNLVAPFTKFSSEAGEYPYELEMSEAVGLCIDEVKAYLLDGKQKPDPQQKLDFGETPEEGKDQAPA